MKKRFVFFLTAIILSANPIKTHAETSVKNSIHITSNSLNGGSMATYFNPYKVVIENNNTPISESSYEENGESETKINLAELNNINIRISGQSSFQENVSSCVQTPDWVAEQQRIAEEQAAEQARQEELLREQQAQIYDVQGRNFASINGTEFDLLCRIVSAEAGSADYCSEAQEMVAEVVLNRMENPSFPNDLTSVIYAGGQFQPVIDGNLETAVVTDTVKNSVYTALKETHNPKNMLYFRANCYHEGLTDYREVCGTFFSLK